MFSLSSNLKWILAVALVGLVAAYPFLTNGPVGTTEAYNYSLGLADTVTQFREGTVPVLAGQTEFAFNGRVHPLRTAPYLYYTAGLLDLVTFHQLGFWSLQNLVLALSLVGAAISCFWSLRCVTQATPDTASALAGLYVFSPPVLAAAYGMDLYMTVTTLPFLPVIVAMCLASFTERRLADLIRLVAALAACWLAHPPVAFWMSAVAGLLQAAAMCLRPPSRREWLMLGAMGLLFAVLSGFSFASALTIAPYQDVTENHDLSLLFAEVSRSFPATFHPISATANQLGDFQLGYVLWSMATAALVLSFARRHLPAMILLAAAGLLFMFTAPVPAVHQWLWNHAPAAAFNLTNQWPMQRLYLVITVLVITAFALVWRSFSVRAPVLRDVMRLVLASAVLWTAWQGLRFVGRGIATRQSQEAINRGHWNSNIDLTPISYALLGTPDSFINGVMDPAFEFRLLAPYDAHEVGSNWTVPLPPAPESRHGIFEARAGDQPEVLDLAPHFTLQPGTRYRLTFHFLVPPENATLQVRGPTMFRQYLLPAAGGPRGFGMRPGHNPSVTLWTAQSTPEEISLRLVAPGIASGSWAGQRFAEFNWERVEPSVLPVRLRSLHPLQAEVTSASAGYLETPRRFIPGYEATVNGRPARAQASPGGQVMLPVPAGDSRIELRYVGPPVVRFAFWISCAGWLGVGLCNLAGRLRPAWRATAITSSIKIPRRIAWTAVALVVPIAASGYGWKKWSDYRQAVGPVRIRFVLPRGASNRQQPLLVTGRPHAGLFVYAVYHDAEHIRIGVDVWGLLGQQTEPIRTDYFAEHEVIVEAGALYPKGHNLLTGLPQEDRQQLANRLKITFDGTTVMEQAISTHDSRPGEVTVGRNLIGGSSCEPSFAGKILSVERLPVPPR